MRKLILLVLAVVFVAACQQQEKQRYFAESAETKTLEAGIAAYESGDWDKWKSHFADTAKIYVNSVEPMTVDARLAQFKETTPSWANYGFVKDKSYIEMVLDKEDETWVYFWGTHKGSFKGSDKELATPVHLAVHFLDGKIVEEHVFFDGTEMAAVQAELAAMAESEESESEE